MSKLVSLSNDAYELLSKRKQIGESFSDVVLREVGKKEKPDIMRFAGILKDNSDAWEKIEREIYSKRQSSKMRDIK